MAERSNRSTGNILIPFGGHGRFNTCIRYMLSLARIKEYVVRELCPDIVESEKKMRIVELSAFLASQEAEVRRHNNKYICMFNDMQVSFDEEPTAELLERYMREPEDYSRQVAAVEDLLREITTKSEKTNPYRNIRTYKEHPPCVNCKGTDYIDCTIHWTCRKCAVTRKKIHQGVAYREMRDRQEDLNGRSMEINTLYSDSFNRRTDIFLPKKTKEWERLQTNNERMNGSKRDTQIWTARERIEEVCNPLQLRDGVVRKAHILFCRHRKTMNVLRSENAVLAACIFYALPKEVKVYRKKKRTLTPWVDSKKRRLKVMDLKTPLKLKKKRRYSFISTLKRK